MTEAKLAYHRARYHKDIEASRQRIRCKDRAKTRLLAKLKNRPCTDCHGWFEACQMDFDHRPGTEKVRNVAAMRGCSLKRLLEEIKKCDLVCANCHRLRTFQRIMRRSSHD